MVNATLDLRLDLPSQTVTVLGLADVKLYCLMTCKTSQVRCPKAPVVFAVSVLSRPLLIQFAIYLHLAKLISGAIVVGPVCGGRAGRRRVFVSVFVGLLPR